MGIKIIISFGPKIDYIKGGRIKLYNEDLYNLNFSLDIWRATELRLTWQIGHVTCMSKTKDLYKNFLWKPKGKRLHLKYILVDNIKMELEKIGYKDVN